ncbi:MAG: hypothetical protein NTV47_04395 [Actinobacteria bacterium]|nr:hypothetical protein [Actinomycetota bacterium]
MSHNAFAFIHTFSPPNDPAVNINKLQNSGLTGINLALNYHASRDFTLGSTPSLRYLEDGAHYYQPDLSKYLTGSIKPSPDDVYQDNSALEKIQEVGRSANFEINAWAVYFHNSAAGKQNPEAVQINGLGQKLLASLCPSNPSAQGYAIGLTNDLISRGIKSIAAESVNFHGLIHGEHHERYFIELSEISQYLLGFCLCIYCQSAAEATGADAKKLVFEISAALDKVIKDTDIWLGKELSIDNLVSIFGIDIKTWISKVVDVIEAVFYCQSTSEIIEIAQSYLSRIQPPEKITGILRPTYPDNSSQSELAKRVNALKNIGITNIDFYLFDVWRERDLEWIKQALI